MIIWPWSENPIVLNMEETFIVTGGIVLVLGAILGFLATWLFGRDSE